MGVGYADDVIPSLASMLHCKPGKLLHLYLGCGAGRGRSGFTPKVDWLHA